MKYDITKIESSVDSDFGKSVSISGNYLIVGDSYLGYHYIYRQSLSGWDEVDSDNKDSNYGYSVDISNYYAVIGYPSENKVNVIQKDEGGIDNWGNINSSLQSNDIEPGDDFGESVAICDNYIIVGAPKKENGSAYLFEIDDNDYITQIKKMAPLSSGNAYFGISVAMTNNYIAIGATGEDVNAGSVYIYYKEDDEWKFIQRITSSDRMNNDNFGNSIGIYSYLLVVGAEEKHYNDIIDSGGAYVYKLSSDEKWYEVKKINPPLVDGDDFEDSNFGHSVAINEDFVIIGASQLNSGEGGAFIYSRLQNWNLINKVDIDNSTTEAEIGTSVAVEGSYFAIGAINEEKGALWLLKRIIPQLKVSQGFEVYDSIPSKASLYLNRIGNNLSNSWILRNDNDVVIDASNFLDIEQSSNKIFFENEVNRYTSNGYMIINPYLDLNGSSDLDFGQIKYSIVAIDNNLYNIWLRNFLFSMDNSGSKEIEIDILIDGKVVDTIISTVDYNEWYWLNAEIILPDNKIHLLSIKMKEKGLILDKIYITNNEKDAIYGEGYAVTQSPFITTHLQVFAASSKFIPGNQLLIYDYKNTVNDITKNGWYNFDISSIDNRINELEINKDYCIILSTSGDNTNNYLTWGETKTNEYLFNYSAIKY